MTARHIARMLFSVSTALVALGCSGGDGDSGPVPAGKQAPSEATHTGLLSIQDVSIHGAPELGHGLDIELGFAPVRAPIYEENPGVPIGCKAWLHDVEDDPAPPLSDQGAVTIEGLDGGPYECEFEPNGGYVCPTRVGFGAVSTAMPLEGTTTYTIEDAAFSAADVGRYLRVGGATLPGNAGAFPIVDVPGPETVIVANSSGTAEQFEGEYSVLAGAGPAPENPADPLRPGVSVSVSIQSGGEQAFDFGTLGPIAPGAAFELDDESAARIAALPIADAPVSFGCAGEGGGCGFATATLLRISTTDADVTGLPEHAMPTPRKAHVEVKCAAVEGDGTISVPQTVMALIALVHASSPMTRIRTAYQRQGLAIGVNSPPGAPNLAVLSAGHTVLGFTSP